MWATTKITSQKCDRVESWNFPQLVVFHRRCLSIEGILPPAPRSTSIQGHPPSKVVFEKGPHLMKLIFHRRLSSIESCLQSLMVSFHHSSSSIKVVYVVSNVLKKVLACSYTLSFATISPDHKQRGKVNPNYHSHPNKDLMCDMLVDTIY